MKTALAALRYVVFFIINTLIVYAAIHFVVGASYALAWLLTFKSVALVVWCSDLAWNLACLVALGMFVASIFD